MRKAESYPALRASQFALPIRALQAPEYEALAEAVELEALPYKPRR